MWPSPILSRDFSKVWLLFPFAALCIFVAFGELLSLDVVLAAEVVDIASEPSVANAQSRRSEALTLDEVDCLLWRDQPKAHEHALQTCKPLAVAGRTSMQAFVGWLYAFGHGVRRDYKEAVYWSRLAAEKGDPNAQLQLGLMLAMGRGTAKNQRESLVWYHRAALQGVATAQWMLGGAYEAGEGLIQDYDAARKWYERAANAGHVEAQIALGLLYAKGLGSVQDPQELTAEAYKWANVAATLATDSRTRQRAIQLRTTVAGLLMSHQIVRSQAAARHWLAEFKARSGRTGTPLVESTEANVQDRQPQEKGRSTSASGFLIGRSAPRVVTNAHAVEACVEIRSPQLGALTLVAKDESLDLALLRASSPLSEPVGARLRGGSQLRAGDALVVVGFPLAGLLSDEPKVSTGTVTSLRGIRNDQRFIQISSPVQVGSSGGPVLDDAGRVVGVVVGKLNVRRLEQVTGDVAQNVNFAISLESLRLFLDANDAKYDLSWFGSTKSSADVFAEARRFTVLIQCIRELDIR